ncbi:Uncharacterized protein K02A2.1 [Durusdinium trenchii]|uniref:Uncharacterized protein K02A2.1 n=1 Tax=Durusdinium trenchii TaxID=1381693 RepID=A0ABP0MX94_9DINO
MDATNGAPGIATNGACTSKLRQAKPGDLVVEEFPITFGGYTYPHGRIAYISGRGPRPVVLVHHNYAGLKQFDVDQACFIARAGYVGLAVDLYQETKAFTLEDRAKAHGRPVDRETRAMKSTFAEGFYAASRAERLDGRSAQEYSQRLGAEDRFSVSEQIGFLVFYEQEGDLDPWQELDLFFDALPKDEEGKVDFQLVRNYIGGFIQMRRVLCDVAGWRDMMKLYLEKAFEHPAVKRGLAGAFGYCLGGQSCLEHVRAGHPVQAVCSLHGLLHSRPTTAAEPFNSKKRMSQEEYAKICPANNYNKDCRILIENGDKDEEVPANTITDFVAEMDAQSIDWRFHNHARGPHGFALGPGVPGCEYTEHIDRRSTLDMLSLFAETWPEFDQHPVECNASGTSFHGFVPWKKRRQNLWSTAAVGILAGAATVAALTILRKNA